jgi:copper chaperone CopZ
MKHLIHMLIPLALVSITAGCSREPAETVISTPAVTRTVVLEVRGMHCEGCAGAIETKAGRVDGVIACDVDLEAETATVEADPACIEEVQAVITSLGYTVTPAEG